jgi:hypothetical protein
MRYYYYISHTNASICIDDDTRGAYQVVVAQAEEAADHSLVRHIVDIRPNNSKIEDQNYNQSE